MSYEKESISQEQYDTLIGKLAKLEEMLGDGLKESVEKLTEDMETFKGSTETLQKDVKVLQEVEPVEIPEVPEVPTTESIQKMIDETVQPVSEGQEKRIETLEKSPLFKGPVDTEPKVEKKEDVMGNVLKYSFPEVTR